MTIRELAERVRSRRPRVVVVGDLILDDWWFGHAGRLSREAPVPVVDSDGHRPSPGGAANTAANLVALGAEAALVGIVGEDDAGSQLLDALRGWGVDVSAVVRDGGRPTTRKTRIVAGESVVVRIDERREHSPEAFQRLRDALARTRPGEALLVCDYGLGAARAAHDVLGRGHDRLLVIDAHDLAPWRDARPDVVTPNLAEAEALVGRSLAGLRDGSASADDVREAAGTGTAVVTLDCDGSVTLTSTGSHRTTTSHAAPEHCASGAGDTFTAALTAALAAGVELPDAADFAQAAADVVVRETGTTVCSTAALLHGSGELVLSLDELTDVVEAQRAAGRRIVFTNGCFDVLHRGHVASLAEARRHGDFLVVAINSDASVRRLKGEGRPINTAEDRAAVLAALGSVDAVTVFDEDAPLRLVHALKPDVYVKGGDYSEEMLVEAQAVREHGGEVKLLGYVPDHSTTDLVERIRHPRMARRTSAEWARGRHEPNPGTLDVLIPTCDRPAELAVTLAGLAAQDDPAFRVIISDQSATPDWEHPAAQAMVRVLEAQGHPVLLERNLPRRGLAQQRQFLLEVSLATAPDATRVLFLDDDVWLEPGQLVALERALDQLECGFVGAAVQGLSYLSDERPQELEPFEQWPDKPEPERVEPGTGPFERWRLHNAANLAHLAARLGVQPGQWLAYKVAWVGGCVLFDRRALVEAGGFGFWTSLPPEHSGEDVAAEWRVMARHGGAGILPSGAVHLESPTTVPNREVDAKDLFRELGADGG